MFYIPNLAYRSLTVNMKQSNLSRWKSHMRIITITRHNFSKRSSRSYEFRTTVVPGLHSEGDLLEIAKLVDGADAFYLQQFRPGGNLDPAYAERAAYPDSFLKQMAEKLSPYATVVGVRGLSY